ncbi:MAG: hypothetical protein K2K88_09900, partial [Muribaculaceae bacterium]|nr:hypothetical protein [Muribaculaceae bacterium]
MSVYHGKDGQSGQDGQNGIAGNTPVIGAKQDSDGRYYWTLNGEWLLDDKREKTPCDGLSAGVAPKFQIKDSNLHLSLDGGDTWVNLGKGTANGQSTNIVVKDIDISKPAKVTFTLSD